ncbi:hypothetical protein G9272_37150 [Streptomyces asoensis]|uniref:NADP-dependent oxidoreductase domain-containing protein n=2 Tax=Streptomyces asoensis TaxID=249586 RepID=A0A6M4WYT2_9ACTN|nr:hypothetical protein G9272_37150 [Streptomyces asoensis]
MPQVYVGRAGQDGVVPRLAAFDRVHLEAGRSRSVELHLEPRALARWDDIRAPSASRAATTRSQFATMQHAAAGHGWTPFVSMQDQYGLLAREEEREMFGLLAHLGVGSIPWSPLAGGRVARPWGQGTTARAKAAPDTDYAGRPLFVDTDEAIVDAVQKIADARGVPMAQVALAWVLRNPVVSAPIVGATKIHHLTDAVAALDLTPTADEIAALEDSCTPRLPTFF